MNKLLYLLIIAALGWSCSDSTTEKYQSNRNKVVNVHDKLVEFNKEEVLFGVHARLCMTKDYLIITDSRPFDKLIHLFDKKSFSHVTGFADAGQGPGDIATLGDIGVDNINRILFVTDHGKQSIFAYPLDSILANPLYIPEVKIKMDERKFPGEYKYINDTLCIGKIITPVGDSSFAEFIAKWNITTGEITPMKYEHPDISHLYKKRICFDVSIKDSIYVECYKYLNLMTICSLNGELKYNIYGRNWNGNGITNRISHYYDVIICNDRIFASYSGGGTYSEEYYPTKFFVFDLTGEYIQTVETGYRMMDVCFDK
jgi:hypothetical protein